MRIASIWESKFCESSEVFELNYPPGSAPVLISHVNLIFVVCRGLGMDSPKSAYGPKHQYQDAASLTDINAVAENCSNARANAPSMCFVSFYSGHLLLLGDHAGVGGAEVQQHILAKALHETGMRVSFVVGADAETNNLAHEHFDVYRSYDRTEGLRFIKFIYPQFYKVWRALKRANCDYYYVRGLRVESGITWLFCALYRRKYVAAIAHDRECKMSTLPSARWNPKTILYVLGLKRAYRVLAQTAWQRQALCDSFQIDATIIKNTMPLDSGTSKLNVRVRKVLWVGTIVPHKRPEIYLKLAAGNPGMEFTMIGPLRYGFEAYRQKIKETASDIPNLKYIDSVNFEEIDTYYRNCDLFVLTSKHEGFPNVLLQAWASGRPVVTSFDPDGIVMKRDLGYVADTESEFERIMKQVNSQGFASALAEMGERARSFVKEFHSPAVIANEIRSALGIPDLDS